MIEALILALVVYLLLPFLQLNQVTETIILLVAVIVVIVPGVRAMFSAPFVPTEKKKMEAMLNLAELNKDSVVMDLGSGDGRFIFEAARRGVKKAIGYELSIPLYFYTKIKSFFIKGADIQLKNFWKHTDNLKEANVIFCFLLVKTMERFETDIWPNLTPGTKVISNTFKMVKIKPSYDKNGIRVYIK